jgi:hypothetical protein
MLSDSLCTASWRARPRSFVSLMTLYESNYVRLGWLLPDVRRLIGSTLSHAAGDCPLEVRVVEHSRYTSTLTLTYLLEDGDGPIRAPDLEVRVYHDARVAEACGEARQHARSPLRGMAEALPRDLDRRWARNMLLNKWLEYCADRGHSFAPAQA